MASGDMFASVSMRRKALQRRAEETSIGATAADAGVRVPDWLDEIRTM
jgi:hypothetical protein